MVSAKYSLGYFLLLTCIGLTLCQVDRCNSYSDSCASCMNSDPTCAWCADENYRGSSRCRLLKNMQPSCSNIVQHISKASISSRPTLNENIQVAPSVVDLDLRVGQPAKFSIEVQPAANYPVDLYYLMDVSFSMRDDLDIMKGTINTIVNEMRTLSNRSSFGFGTFVDKPIAPFMDPSRYRRQVPCTGFPDFDPLKMVCDPTYGFVNAMPVTDDVNKFKNRLAVQNISSNLDSPEGGLDALLQVAVCTERIGWRSGARHVVIYASDSNYHYSGDGKLAGITKPNDGQCRVSSEGLFNGIEMDYPSLRQLRDKLEQFQILPVFAVTKRTFGEYVKLQNTLVGIGSLLGELSSNSSNIIEIIKNSYQTLVSTVQLFSTSTNDLNVAYDAICDSNDVRKGSNTCTNVGLGKKVTFNVSVTATRCPRPGITQEEFKIRVLGFGEVTVRAKYVCECGCALGQAAVPNSPRCTMGNGTYACGVCVCNPGRFGNLCQCDSEAAFSDTSGCKVNSTAILCSNRGDCQCGSCYCRQPQELCNGQGTCECGRCNCNSSIYTGRACDYCPTCPGICSANKECVECKVFASGQYSPAECSAKCSNVIITTVNTLNVIQGQERCVIPRTNSSCQMMYVHSLLENGTLLLVVQENEVCPQPPNIAAIVAGTVGGVIGAGLLILLIWKIMMMLKERKEFNEFESQRKKEKWNAIYGSTPDSWSFRNSLRIYRYMHRYTTNTSRKLLLCQDPERMKNMSYMLKKCSVLGRVRKPRDAQRFSKVKDGSEVLIRS
ncbi:uncharacterized protein TRIADDRAFT_54882 [Trichoplax adhaerens]|uniref:Integrin beta n=1 Tax=Trichoplax adhaerens TaxID=10228 RepID=B3RT93_TRIAD|nr:hypothetical protein TRIADDRAFT_54882 [Trichoplax adhaerens]EDV26654.1 hypothetical protein TRIADDRAFT_54882 [Trichoplax adhaerens]|eukprot:XP_002110650.1 hypothetical protein TRIADDRAFT_54882 [Trichoplax adhaerens]